MHVVRLVAALPLLLVLGGCIGDPVGTPAVSPASTATAAANVPTKPTPAALPSAAASAPPIRAPSRAPTTSVTISTPPTNETVFLPDEAFVPAGAEVVLTFENRTTLAHNLVLEPPIDARTQIVEQGQSDTIVFTAPDAGSYGFLCTLHPWMTGRLVVGEAP